MLKVSRLSSRLSAHTVSKTFVLQHRCRSIQEAFALNYFKLMKVIPLNGPIVGIKNWLIGFHVRNVLCQDFNLKSFLDACPYAVSSLCQVLNDKEVFALSDLMSMECSEKVCTEFNQLEQVQQRDLCDMDPELVIFVEPHLHLVKKSNDVTLLQAKVMMVQYVDLQYWDEFMETSVKMKSLNFDKPKESFKEAQNILNSISIQTVYLERNVTKGAERSNWKFINMGHWPRPYPLLKKMTKK